MAKSQRSYTGLGIHRPSLQHSKQDVSVKVWLRVTIGYKLDIVVDLFYGILRQGGHGVMLCSFLQFKDWHRSLDGLVNVVKVNHDVDPSKELLKEE